MATVALVCPYCKSYLRVSVQPSRVTKTGDSQLKVQFDDQLVAHVCKEK